MDSIPQTVNAVRSLSQDASEYGTAIVVLMSLLVVGTITFFLDKRSQRKIEEAREAERLRIEKEREERDQAREERLGKRLDEMQNMQTGVLLEALRDNSRILAEFIASNKRQCETNSEQARAIERFAQALELERVSCLKT